MTVDRDGLWADLVQFDPPTADRVWDGDLADPDAPTWYGHLGDLIHRARGPAESDELVDEPVLVDTMRRASLGAALTVLPRRPGARTVGRVVAMKATAAVTAASMVGVAAATTGIMASVVVPVLNEKVLPAIQAHVLPTATTEHPQGAGAQPSPSSRRAEAPGCTTHDEFCVAPGAPVVVDLPAVPAPAGAVAAPVDDATRVAPSTPATPVPVAEATATTATTATAAPTAATDPAPVDPAPIVPTNAPPADPGPAASANPPTVDPGPAHGPPDAHPSTSGGRAGGPVAPHATGGPAGSAPPAPTAPHAPPTVPDRAAVAPPFG